MRLEAQGLGFGYPGKPVGRDVSFALGSGEVLCLLGPNGSGKTTLFKTLLGLCCRPRRARSLIDGQRCAGSPGSRSRPASPMCRRRTSRISPTPCPTW